MTQEDFVVACSRNPVRLVLMFGLVPWKDRSDLIWSLFSENGTAADALTEAPIYNPVLQLVLKLSWCVDVCVTIELKKIPT